MLRKKTKGYVRSIESSISIVAGALKVGAHPGILRMAMMEDGLSRQKAELIIRWAKRINESNTSQT